MGLGSLEMGLDALIVCGEFVGRMISGLCSPQVWAILLVTMQQRLVPPQPVYQATHILPLGARTLQQRPVPCLTSDYRVGGAFSFNVIREDTP